MNRNNIYKFKTKNFVLSVDRLDEPYPDFSWDETGETAEKVESGEWDCFSVAASIYFRGEEIASDYLGNCIYLDFREFRDNLGIRKHVNCGSYFSDMVSECVKAARKHFQDLPRIKAH
jgi:hypothetical protein